jgi:hypothetical protein
MKHWSEGDGNNKAEREKQKRIMRQRIKQLEKNK